jgi:leucyl/phenylalanyl-tRNA--protein transferase
MSQPSPVLPWLMPGDPLPDLALAWGEASEAPGLLAAGGVLSVESLQRAYQRGIFPWFSPGQPILWWSPDPRMVLQVAHFRLHRSLRKTLQRFKSTTHCEVRMDCAFEQVITSCAQSERGGTNGTWIVPAMVDAYTQLHAAGHAHSVETWVNGELVGGLYCVALGRAVFGESMFARVPDASKIALAALVAFCRRYAITMIDCQQNTAHLASLGAREMPRSRFVAHVAQAAQLSAPEWHFSPLYWDLIFRLPE